MSVLPGLLHAPVGFGPGSQPDAGEEGLAYLPMPSGMRTYQAHLPDAVDPAAGTLLARLQATLAAWLPGQEARLSLDGATPATLAALDDTLGEGEVSVLVAGRGGRIEIQEAALAGVWRVRAVEDRGATRDSLLVGAFPRVAVSRAFVATAAPAAAAAGPGVMNALPILTELLDRAARCRPGDGPHAVNFSLLPHTPEDLAHIEARLGTGATTILSRGYGNCRVTATATTNLWWVRYYNSVDTPILDTLEAVDVPAVVCAAPEDIADSAGRLAEILAALGWGTGP